jgi:hypothetical protein
MTDNKVFVATTATAGVSGHIGPAEVKASEPGVRAVVVYLDERGDVVHKAFTTCVRPMYKCDSEYEREIEEKPSAEQLKKAEYMVVLSADGKRVDDMHIVELRLKGSDGKFFDNGHWYNDYGIGGFTPIALTVDDHGFVNLDDPQVKSKLRAASIPLLNMRSEQAAAEVGSAAVPDRWKTGLQLPHAPPPEAATKSPGSGFGIERGSHSNAVISSTHHDATAGCDKQPVAPGGSGQARERH